MTKKQFKSIFELCVTKTTTLFCEMRTGPFRNAYDITHAKYTCNCLFSLKNTLYRNIEK